jgi:hypothetical protein
MLPTLLRIGVVPNDWDQQILDKFWNGVKASFMSSILISMI